MARKLGDQQFIETATLLSGVLVTGAGTGVAMTSGPKVAQAYVVGTGAVTATVKFQGSLGDGYWNDIDSVTLSGTTSASDAKSWVVPWPQVRANVTAISGTGAAVTVYVSGQ